MDFKTYCEDAEVTVTVTITVNGEQAFTASSFSIDGAIEELGKAERANVIYKAAEEQYHNLPEPLVDEETGMLI